MNTPFDDMPDNARVWIYQANKSIETKNLSIIDTYVEKFLKDWAAHGAPLKGAHQVFHNQFLIIAVDESYNKASGCSIDSSVAIVRQISEELSIDFFDRSKLYFLIGDEIKESSISDIKNHVKEGKVKEETLTFNNLVPTIGDFKNQWVTPASNSWLSRYF